MQRGTHSPNTRLARPVTSTKMSDVRSSPIHPPIYYLLLCARRTSSVPFPVLRPQFVPLSLSPLTAFCFFRVVVPCPGMYYVSYVRCGVCYILERDVRRDSQSVEQRGRREGSENRSCPEFMNVQSRARVKERAARLQTSPRSDRARTPTLPSSDLQWAWKHNKKLSRIVKKTPHISSNSLFGIR